MTGSAAGAAACCACAVTTYLLLLGTSAVVLPNTIGIRMSSITNKVDLSTTYPAGRHWFQPFSKFVIFPLNVQNVPMRLTTRTAEGYPLDIKAEFQYQLLPEKVTDLYNHYTINYEQVYQRNVRAAMMKAMSDYDAPAIFKKRADILRDMETRVDQVLRESYAMCWGVQFDDVKQPEAFEKTLLLTQLQEWFSKQKLAEQHISAIQAKTQVLKAEFNKNISVVSSTADNRCQYIMSAATAQSSNYENEAKSNATLLTDRATAQGSVIQREAVAHAELKYQESLAEGNAEVLKEQAEATMRKTQLEGLRLAYWKEHMQLTAAGLVQFQKLLGSYEKLNNVTFLFGFENAYATADATPAGHLATARIAGNTAQLAAIAGAAMHNSGSEL